MNQRTFIVGVTTHSQPAFPPLGENNIEINVKPDEKILHVKLQITDVIAAAAQAAELNWGHIGPQTINVKWQLFAPNSRITFQLEVTAEQLNNSTGRVILFNDKEYAGDILDIIDGSSSIVYSPLHDSVSSIAVLKGNWIFYRNIDFDSPYSKDNTGGAIILSPGLYPWVVDKGIKNDDISSLRAVVL